MESLRERILKYFEEGIKTVAPTKSKEIMETFRKEITDDLIKDVIKEKEEFHESEIRLLKSEQDIHADIYNFSDLSAKVLARIAVKYPQYEYELKELLSRIEENADMARIEYERARNEAQLEHELYEYFKKKIEKAI